MKGWIAFNDAKKHEFKLKASAINGVGPCEDKGYSTLILNGLTISVDATEEEVFKAIELAEASVIKPYISKNEPINFADVHSDRD